MAEIIQQEWFKHANPAKACFLEGANTLRRIIIEGAFAKSNVLILKEIPDDG
jgi:hypothetical protein